jgi:DNA-binding NarL/FixJ family response regulator
MAGDLLLRAAEGGGPCRLLHSTFSMQSMIRAPQGKRFAMPNKILIADDNAQIRFLIRSLVESAEFTVIGEAGDGKEVVEKARQLRPDLILLDLAMPIVNGAQAAAILKEQLPTIPVILFTLHADKSLASHLGVAKVIGKPDGMTKLRDSIREVLGIPSPPVIGPLKIAAAAGIARIHLAHSTTPSEDKPPE